jgi:hypothetical protein
VRLSSISSRPEFLRTSTTPTSRLGELEDISRGSVLLHYALSPKLQRCDRDAAAFRAALVLTIGSASWLFEIAVTSLMAIAFRSAEFRSECVNALVALTDRDGVPFENIIGFVEQELSTEVVAAFMELVRARRVLRVFTT